jgi:hypothetical protein
MRHVFELKIVKIRKPCHCFGCSKKMPRGTIMQKFTEVEDGVFHRAALCPVCLAFWNKYMTEEG